MSQMFAAFVLLSGLGAALAIPEHGIAALFVWLLVVSGAIYVLAAGR